MSYDQRRNVVFTNGCFDILHVGHFNILHECRRLAGPVGQVIVGLDSDEKVKKDKGSSRPIFSYEERKSNLMEISICHNFYHLVTNAIRFNTNEELYELVKLVNPEYIIKGKDWENKEVIGSDIAKVCFVDICPNISTTDIISRVLKKNENPSSR